MTDAERIQKSWDVRLNLIEGVLARGTTIVEAMKLAPDMGKALTFDKWREVVAEELKQARELYGNGEPLLSEDELVALAAITWPARGLN